MIVTFALTLVALFLFCGDVLAETESDSSSTKSKQHQRAGLPEVGDNITNNDPKNTSQNQRDWDHNSTLPEDQSNKKDHLDRTATIRNLIANSDHFSTTAKNIKIITLDDGTVILRGPVGNAKEKSDIEEISRKHSGGSAVKSYLEISE